MKVLGMVILAAAAGTLAGCGPRTSLVDERATPERAHYSDEKIELRTIVPVAGSATGPAASEPALPAEAGRWTYTTPTTVTRDEHKNGVVDEVSFFVGRPGPEDLPFLVISTTRSRATRAEHDPTFKIQNQREYSMNGNIVHEWTGQTAMGAGFSELLIRRPGDTGDELQVCHVIALARTDDEQTLAKSIMGSIAWTPTP